MHIISLKERNIYPYNKSMIKKRAVMRGRILLLDDDFEDLKSVKSILEKSGYNVTAVTSGSRAIEALHGNRIDAIIIDVSMSYLSGYEILRIIKEKSRDGFKVICLTLANQEEVSLDFADGLVKKPFSQESILKIVNKVIARKKVR